MLEYKDKMNRLNDILKQNDLSLIDEFEDELMQLIKKVETSNFFIDINSMLIRNTYYLIVMIYGEKASIKDFKTLINNSNNEGVKTLKDFLNKKVTNSDIQKENERIVNWFLNDYYADSKGVKKFYEYSIETRYFIDKINLCLRF